MTTKKNAMNIKSQVIPLIQTEGAIISGRIILLAVRETLFKTDFLKGAQFEYVTKRLCHFDEVRNNSHFV